MVEATPATGTRYRHVRTIADGGMGTVSLAVREEGRFRRAYAIKRLLPAHQQDSAIRSMFLEEARIAGLLHHPNIVSVVDVGEDEDGPYLLMDYVQGVPLSDLVKDAREREELIPVQVCVRIVKQVALGLHAAHELVGHDGTKLELVHRDVSPQNILVGYDGVARLTDFGIAKALGRTDRTQTGVLKGKFGYFSPEQLQFDEPTRRSDIFSLGVVLYETLSARRLYGGNDGAKAAKRILKETPPDIDQVRSDVHPALIELLFRMLAKDPERRPATAEEVAEVLDSLLVDLLLDEGALSVSQYVLERFDERKERQRREVDELTAAPAVQAISQRPRRRRRQVMLLALAGVAFAAWVGSRWLPPTEVVETRSPVAVKLAEPVVEKPTAVEMPAAAEEPEPIAAAPKRVRPTKPRPKPRARPKPKPALKPSKPSKTPAEKDLMNFDD